MLIWQISAMDTASLIQTHHHYRERRMYYAYYLRASGRFTISRRCATSNFATSAVQRYRAGEQYTVKELCGRLSSFRLQIALYMYHSLL